jgi:YD repeat-containing protein
MKALKKIRKPVRWEKRVYDKNDRLVLRQDNKGGWEIVNYDVTETIVEERRTDSGDWKRITKGKNWKKVERPLGFIYTEYNDNGRVIRVSNQNGVVIEKAYDEEGRLIKSKTGHVLTEYVYDKLGRFETRKSDGSFEFREYDKEGYLITLLEGSADGDEVAKRFLYDNGLLVYEEVERDGKTTWVKRTFDEDGRLMKLSNHNGFVATYKYSSKGQLIEHNKPDCRISYFYDDLDRQYKEVFENKCGTKTTNVTEFLKDTRLVCKRFNNGHCYESAYYDDDKNIIRYEMGLTTVPMWKMYDYDKRGRLVREESSDGRLITIEYNENGREVLYEWFKK